MPGLFDPSPLVFAQNGAPALPGSAQGLWTFLPYVAIIGLWFYLLLIRPQQKQDRDRRQMIAALKRNDRVLTSAGIYGTVVSVDEKDDRVLVRIGEDDRGVKVAFTKAGIVRVVDGAADKVKEKDLA